MGFHLSRPRVVTLGTVVLGGVLLSACGGSSPTSPAGGTTPAATPAPTPTPAPDYDGQWSGTTSEKKAVKMTVASQQVTAFTMKFTTRYGSTSCTETFTLTAPADIAGNQAKIAGKTPSLGKFNVDVTFDSNTMAHGEMGDITGNGLICVSTGTFVFGSSTKSLGGPWTFEITR